MGKSKGKIAFSLIGAAFGGGLFSGGLHQLGASVLTGAISGLSLGSTIWSATHKPKAEENYSRFDVFANTVDSTARIPVIYGTRKYGGLQSYHLASSDGKSLTKDIIISEGEIQGIYGITANELSIANHTTPDDPMYNVIDKLGKTKQYYKYPISNTHVFSLVNVKYSDATVSITSGGSTGNDKVLHLYANGKTTNIALQHPSDLASDQSNDYSCYIYKLLNYIGGIGYSTTLDTEGWLVVNPAITTDPPENIGTITVTSCYNAPVSVGIGRLASSSSHYDFYSGASTGNPPSNYMTVGGYRNMAWLRAHLVQSSALQGGSPNITYICQGMKVVDTRTGVVGYSENPAMIVRDYLLSKRYGCGHFITPSELDEESFKEVADYCDELVTYIDHNGNTIIEPRYTLNIILDTKKKHAEHLQDMFSAFGGFLVFTNNHIGLRIEKSTPVSYAFTDETIVADSIVYTGASTETMPNRWNVTYYDPLQNWTGIKCIVEDTIGQQSYPVGRGKVIPKDVTLVGCTRQSQASRLGRLMRDIALLCPLRVQWQTATMAMHLEPGDVVTITKYIVVNGVKQRLFTDLPLRILEISNNKGIYTIKGQQYNDSVYNDNLGSKITVKNYSSIPSAITGNIPEVSNFTSTQQYYTQTDGTIVSNLIIRYDLPNYQFFNKVNISYSIDGGSVWTNCGNTSDNTFTIPNAIINKQYRVKIAVENNIGRKSSGVVFSAITITGKDQAPSTPVGLSVSFTDKCEWTWNQPIDNDIVFAELRTNTSIGTNAGLLAKTSSTKVNALPPTRTGNVYLYFKDRSDNYSNACILGYNKPAPVAPSNVVLTNIFQGFTVTCDALPAYCLGINVHINDGSGDKVYFSPNNSYVFKTTGGIFDVSVAYVDIFGEGTKSATVRRTIVATVDPALLASESISLAKMDTVIKDAIAKAQSSVSTTSLAFSLTTVNTNIASANALITTANQNIASAQTTITANKTATDSAIATVDTKVTGITTTVASNKTDIEGKLTTKVAEIKVTTDAISSLVGTNKTGTDSAISLINQTATALSATVSANKTDANNKITANTTLINQTATNITSVVSANKTASDNAISVVDQKANGISTTVASNKTDIEGKLTTKVSEIKQTTDAISATVATKANASDLTLTNNSITATVAKLNSAPDAVGQYSAISQLKQTADAITSTVSNMAIGGRNYALKTAGSKTTGTGWNSIFELSPDTPLSATFTISFDYTTSVSNGAGIGWGTATAYNGTYFALPSLVGTTLKHYSYTGTLTRLATGTHICLYVNGTSTTVTNFKLEVGNKETDWTPAPEDTDYAVSQIKQTTDSITSVVTANKVAQDGVNTTTSTAIAQANSDIQLRATKANLISLINVCPESISLNSDLVHISGDTLIDDNVIVGKMISAGSISAEKMATGSITIGKFDTATAGLITTAQTTANTAITNASTAKTQADLGVANALIANNLLADMSNDAKLTPVEKISLQQTWAIIGSEYTLNLAQGTAMAVSTTAYTTSYNTLNSYVPPLLTSLTTTSAIVGATFRANFKAYYDARTTLLNSIATATEATANTAVTNAATAQTTANTAVANAAIAQTTANNAVTNAATANSLLADISSDGKLTPNEKTTVKQTWDSIVSEYTLNLAQATTFGITTTKTAYTTAYNALNTYITPLLTTLTATSAITRTTFNSTFKAYYDARTNLLNAIALSAKVLADTAQDTADTKTTQLEVYNSYIDQVTPLVFNHIINVTVTGNDIAKTAGVASTWDASFSATRLLYNGNFAEYTVAILGHNIMFGLSSSWDNASYTSIDYAIYQQPNNTITIYEDGTNKAISATSVVIGDKLRVSIENNKVKYYKNNTLFYTSLRTPTLPMILDASFYVVGGKINDVTVGTAVFSDMATLTATAQTTANTANALLADIADDNKLTSLEKHTVQKEWDVIKSEYTLNLTFGTSMAVSTTAYTTAYNALNTYITPLLTSLTTTSVIVGTTFRSTFKAYYDAKVNVLNAIATATELTANTAITNASTAQTTANTAITNASTAKTQADLGVANALIANNAIAEMSSDSKISPFEKISLNETWALIKSEYALNLAQGTSMGISTTAMTTAYNTLNTYVPPLLTSMTTTSAIVGATYRANFKAYYDAKIVLLNAIATATEATANLAVTNAATAQTTANTAVANASTAQNTANTAVTNATTANTLLADIASDGKLTPNEKTTVKQTWDSITSEYSLNLAQATSFSITTTKTAYTTAYNALNTYITPLLTTLTATSVITRTTFNSTFKAYYDARTNLLNAIALSAKSLADTAQTTANTAVTNASTANTQINAWKLTGTTKINGGAIATDSITAAQIKAGTITANEIAAGAITADMITTGTLSANIVLSAGYQVKACVMVKGTIAHGGTISLPSGYTAEQCVWGLLGAVKDSYRSSIRTATPSLYSVSPDRVVTVSASENVTVYASSESNGYVPITGLSWSDYGGSVYYWILGVK